MGETLRDRVPKPELIELQDRELDILEQLEVVLTKLTPKDRREYSRLFNAVKAAEASHRKIDAEASFATDATSLAAQKSSQMRFRAAFIKAQAFKNTPNRQPIFMEYDRLQDELRLVREELRSM